MNIYSIQKLANQYFEKNSSRSFAPMLFLKDGQKDKIARELRDYYKFGAYSFDSLEDVYKEINSILRHNNLVIGPISEDGLSVKLSRKDHEGKGTLPIVNCVIKIEKEESLGGKFRVGVRLEDVEGVKVHKKW